jgi:hypothetical protein
VNADLFKALGAFVNPTRVRIYRDGETEGDWHVIPSVWAQLAGSSQTGSGQGGAARYGSRPVISTPVVALIIAVETAVTEACMELVGGVRRDIPDGLRAVCATIKDDDQVGWWTDQLRDWTAQARGHLHLDPDRPRSARGARCPACQAKDAQMRHEGETVRMPALAITWVGPEDDGAHHADAEWRVRAVECRACHTAWWRGSDLDNLVEAMMAGR